MVEKKTKTAVKEKKRTTPTKATKSAVEAKAKSKVVEKPSVVVARSRYLRMSPRKIGLVLAMIRGRKAAEARNILKLSPKRAARAVLKVLESAVANAKHNLNLDEKDLVVAKALGDPGPTLKRGIAASRGRWHRILKRTTHVTIELTEANK